MTTAIAENIEQAQQREQEYQQVGRAFLAALGSRDFETLGSLLHPWARMRSLQWAGYVDYVGRDEILADLRGWFESGTELEVVATSLGIVGERLHVGYHYRVLRPGHEDREEVEQHVYFQLRNGRVLSLDLICSGYRPANVLAASKATGVAA